MAASPHDTDKEGGEIVPLSRREVGGATETETVREEAVDDVKVRATDLREDGRVTGEERENGATEVTIERATAEVTIIRALCMCVCVCVWGGGGVGTSLQGDTCTMTCSDVHTHTLSTTSGTCTYMYLNQFECQFDIRKKGVSQKLQEQFGICNAINSL